MEPHPHPHTCQFIFLIISFSVVSISAQQNQISASPSPSPTSSISYPPSESPNSSPESHPPPVDSSVKKICDSTDYPDLCLSTVSPLLNGKTDIMAVLDAAMNGSAQVTKEALDLAKKLASEPGASDACADCKDSYENALDNFQEAMVALPSRDIGRMNSMLSAVMTDVGDCQDEFDGTDNPLATFADTISKLASNCLAIVSLMP